MVMTVLYYDVKAKLSIGNARQVDTLDQLASSDIVSLHVPDLPSTQWMITTEQLRIMKQGAHLINASGDQ